jgi:RNA methyltransferase, TrmH family
MKTNEERTPSGDRPRPRENFKGSGQAPDRSQLRLSGLAAVRARFARHPDSIRRLYFDYPTGKRIGLLCKALAAQRKIYRCVEPSELEKLAGTIHHGGVVAVCDAPEPAPVRAGDPAAWAARAEPLLVLDRIGNAHNLGAIARTAVFFRVPRILISDDPSSARPNDAAYRVAEGGLEWLEVRLMPVGPAFFTSLAAAGYDVVGAVARGGKSPRRSDGDRPRGVSTGDKPLADRPRPVALVLGNEEHGLDPAVQAACTRLVTLEGAREVESLNVSAAAAVLVWEFLVPRK